jgi:hypothetical protein
MGEIAKYNNGEEVMVKWGTVWYTAIIQKVKHYEN